MYIFGPKSGHFEKSRPLTVSEITSLESPYVKTYPWATKSASWL
jgi:hypothetical protein